MYCVFWLILGVWAISGHSRQITASGPQARIRCLYLRPTQKKIHFMGCVIPAKTEKANWAQIWSRHDGTFCIKPSEFCSLRIDGVQALTQQTPYEANKFTRKMFYSSACKFQICIWLLSCYMGLFLLVKRKFIMQVLTLMVINCSKHDVRIVNPRTKHHYWNLRTVSTRF